MFALFGAMFPQAARDYAFRNSLIDREESEWMCIICGFDNNSRSEHCIMCGTSHEFSDNYKSKKIEKHRLAREAKDAKTKKRLRINVASDIFPDTKEDNDDDPLRVSLLPRPSIGTNSRYPDNAMLATPNKSDAISIPDEAQLSSISLSLKHFSPLPLTNDERAEAINYRLPALSFLRTVKVNAL
jgi:hypothetical protein